MLQRIVALKLGQREHRMIFDIQKASTLKRASAFLLDLILFAILAVGVAWLISLACNYDAHIEIIEQSMEYHKTTAEAEFGVDLDISESDFNNLSTEEQENWTNANKAYTENFSKDPEANKTYVKVISFTLLMVSLGVFISMMVLEFCLPLIFKNGQTVGKKVFGIGVIHQNGVRVNTITMFIRTFLGKYTVETMVPVLLIFMLFMFNTGIISVVVIGLLLILEIALFFGSKGMHTLIHDVFAKTVTVDIASQMVFQDENELAAFRNQTYTDNLRDQDGDGSYASTNTISGSFVQLEKTPSDTTDEPTSTNEE